MENIITVLISTILSGAFATIVTLWWQNKMQLKQEKIRIFTILMAKRYEITAEECVEALNMIDIVFYRDSKVRTAWREFKNATDMEAECATYAKECVAQEEVCKKAVIETYPEKEDKKFVKAFTAVYPDGLSEKNITDAIEEFERTLITPNSRFDKWLRGDDSALTAEHLTGYELFKKYDCATCHAGKNLGGLSYELMGLRRHYFAERGLELTEEDNGRYKETKNERDRHRFKVPGLRNVEHTWPYYHDGTRHTLEEAVLDMGKYQSGVDLAQAEVDKITAYLKTLTGEYQGKPVTTTNSPEDIHGHE